jgi:hypothetical protein
MGRPKAVERRLGDGSPQVVLDTVARIERLPALVPRPRLHLETYTVGTRPSMLRWARVFAPAAAFRDRIAQGPPIGSGHRVSDRLTRVEEGRWGISWSAYLSSRSAA